MLNETNKTINYCLAVDIYEKTEQTLKHVEFTITKVSSVLQN